MVSCSTIVIYTASSDPAYLTRRNRCAGGAIVVYEVYAEPQSSLVREALLISIAGREKPTSDRP